MPEHDIIVIGGSTGSIDVLRQLCAELPPGLPAAVFIVVHIGAQGQNVLAGIFGAAGPLPAATANDREPITPGRIYVAPADHHLLLHDGLVRLGRGPRENMTRPAIDPLFRSAAATCGSRVIGVVLSGHLNDGAAGLSAIKQCGGLTVVQSPADAAVPDMPVGALQSCDVDYKAPASELAALLAQLVRQPAAPPRPVPPAIVMEAGFALGHPSDSPQLRQIADPCTLPCPACGGVLSEIHDPNPLRFRCQIGHAYTAECLDRDQDASVHQALGVSLRALESRATLLERMAEDARAKNRPRSAIEFADRAKDYRRDADTVRAALLRAGAQGEHDSIRGDAPEPR